MFRYAHDSWETVTATPLWTNGSSFPTIQTNFVGPATSLVARLTATASPTLLNEFVFSYTTDHIVLTQHWAHRIRMRGNARRTLAIGSLFPATENGASFRASASPEASAAPTAGRFRPGCGFDSQWTVQLQSHLHLPRQRNQDYRPHNLQFGAYFVAAQKNELSCNRTFHQRISQLRQHFAGLELAIRLPIC